MGSMPQGTLCSYCAVREAGYIPDGAVGPMCMGQAECCYERGCVSGWEVIMNERWLRLGRMRSNVLCKDQTAVPTLGIDIVELKVAEFLWRA